MAKLVKFIELPLAEELRDDVEGFRDWMDNTKTAVRKGVIKAIKTKVPMEEVMSYEPADDECKKLMEYCMLEAVEVECTLCPKDCKRAADHAPELVEWIKDVPARELLADLMATDMAASALYNE
jgi:hypothetical protein